MSPTRQRSAKQQPGSETGGNTRRPRLKYQVFISSTYADLHKERERVVWAILEARHIPAGMENFTATDERGWRTITRVIDDTDYYVLILGGLYGSVDPTTGISWTQREYEYATSKRIPVLAFIREPSSISGNMVERDPEKMRLLEQFIERVRTNHLCKPWKTAEDLSAAVASALRNHIQDDEDEEHPRPGWIRGDTVPSMTSLDEFARLSSENARLKGELDAVRNEARLPVLQLVSTRDESPFQAILVEGPVLSAHRHGPVVGKYLKQRSNTLWLKLAIKNSGQIAAKNVVANFQFPEATGLHIELENPGKTKRISNANATNPASHCHVDSHSEKDIRQRLKLIAPGFSEHLVPFGVEFADGAVGKENSLTCHYSIADESGASERGQFIVRMKWTRSEDVTATIHLLPDLPPQD